MNRQFKWAMAAAAVAIGISGIHWAAPAVQSSSPRQATPMSQPVPAQSKASLNTQSPKPNSSATTDARPTPKPTLDPGANLPHDWIMPVNGQVTNPFGNSYQYYSIYRGGHTGVDISAARGMPIKAVANGKVVRIFAVPNMRYGQYIVIEHNPGLFSLYGHTQSVLVKLGQVVKQGQQIATIGTSGAAGYPHLHIEALNRLPYRDGAWGYLYICYARTEKFTFINQNAKLISAIQRQYGNSACGPKPMHEPVIYFNPEVLWSKAPVLHMVKQPENEEWSRYRRNATANKPGPATAVARPGPGVPVIKPLAVQNQLRTAPPDKSAAPGEATRQ